MQKYNGWINRETWLVNVHFNPETTADLEYLKEHLEDIEDDLPLFFRDFVDLSLIDWDELSEHVTFDDEDEQAEYEQAA